MGGWNYVVTAHKPTNVTHSCAGSFTNPPDLNLIIGKCTRLEIHLLTALGLQVNNLWNCEKNKREKERKGESDKGKNLGMEN
jgi:hypothetical protein